jgi:hypothetical protein
MLYPKCHTDPGGVPGRLCPPETAGKGWKVIRDHIGQMNGSPVTAKLKKKLARVQLGERDLYF